MTAREAILNRIADAKRLAPVQIPKEPDWNESGFMPISMPLIDCFSKEIQEVSGECIVVGSEREAMQRLSERMKQEDVTELYCRDESLTKMMQDAAISVSSAAEKFVSMKIGITRCEFLVARTGSVLVSSAHASGRQMNVFPPIHVVLAYSSQLVPYVVDAYAAMRQKYGDALPSFVSLITGPSRTADIEKTLVLGAHGPKKLWVLIVKNDTGEMSSIV
ncbi:MAG: LutC/YkgG family protein [Microbacter sp.]